MLVDESPWRFNSSQLHFWLFCSGMWPYLLNWYLARRYPYWWSHSWWPHLPIVDSIIIKHEAHALTIEQFCHRQFDCFYRVFDKQFGLLLIDEMIECPNGEIVGIHLFREDARMCVVINGMAYWSPARCVVVIGDTYYMGIVRRPMSDYRG